MAMRFYLAATITKIQFCSTDDLDVFLLNRSISIQKRNGLLVASKILLEKIIPTWGVPMEFQRNRGTHFTGQIIQQYVKFDRSSNTFIVHIVSNRLDWWNVQME